MSELEKNAIQPAASQLEMRRGCSPQQIAKQSSKLRLPKSGKLRIITALVGVIALVSGNFFAADGEPHRHLALQSNLALQPNAQATPTSLSTATAFRGSSSPENAAVTAGVSSRVSTTLDSPDSTAELATAPIQITVSPANAHLTTVRDRQSFVVQASFANGLTKDVTHESQWQIANSELVRLDQATLYPALDGSTEMVVSYGGHEVTIPVVVERASEDPAISFRLDVMPVFMKTGCNQGSCHGAARGKDGFRLSLFGFDPEGDYHRITREIPGRRVNLAIPEQSLLLEKSVGTVPHTGGTRMSVDSEYYATIMRWLESRTPNDPGPVATVTSLEIYPANGVLDGEGETQRLTIRAMYSDGTDRDVTSLAYFSSNNDNSATVSQQGVITAHARGEAFIMARFDTHTVGSHFIVLPKGLDFTWSDPVANNYVDEHVHEKLRKLRINPSEVCSDEVFVRRVYLDICGILPTVDEFKAFVDSTEPNKREDLVDELLDRKEFVEIWVMKWAELLQIRSTQQVSYKSMLLYYNWLQERVADNVPMNQMVQELLASRGGTFANAATNYYQAETNTLKVAENVAQVFMGMRIQCAQCHNHPFDRWTMDDYYGFAAFFSQIGRKRGEDPRETIVFNSRNGDVRHPVDNRVMVPKFLGGEVPELGRRDRREVMAEWLVSPENSFFSQNLANIVWSHFLGSGIINEVDDVRVSNPAVNPELLEAMAAKIVEYEYDFKKIVRDICTSRTYQLTTQTNESNEKDATNFSHANLRRLRAEVLLDTISLVTETQNKFRGLPLGARAVQIADGNTSNYFLTAFGRASRETVCACEVKVEPNLSQALHLLNGDTLHSKIRQGQVVETMLNGGATPEAIIEDLYIRCFTRRPTDQELTQLVELVNEEENKRIVLEDIFWALLNSREFVFNH